MLFFLNIIECKVCFGYGGDRRNKKGGALFMVILIIATTIALLIIFKGVFDDIDILFGYEPRVFIVIMLIGSLKSFVNK